MRRSARLKELPGERLPIDPQHALLVETPRQGLALECFDRSACSGCLEHHRTLPLVARFAEAEEKCGRPIEQASHRARLRSIDPVPPGIVAALSAGAAPRLVTLPPAG